jgi:hypothetical protein
MFDAPPMLQPLIDGVRAPFRRSDDVAHYRTAPDWALDVSKDRFTGMTHCAVRTRGLTYRDGVVTLHFGHGVNTANALFRVDGGPARSVGEVAVEAAGKGAVFLSRNTTNPSNGEVHIPTTQLAAHRSLAVRPNARASVRTIDLAGLAPSLKAAEAHGCPQPEAAAPPSS